MGTSCHVIAHGGGEAAVAEIVADIERLAALWTRFDDASEVSRLNAAVGRRMSVTADTRRLAQRALLGWQLSGGRFDPFQVDRMPVVGYGQDFDALATVDPPTKLTVRRTRPPVVIDPRRNTVLVTAGNGLDSGGIGKGFAADLAAGAALRRGVRSVLVNLGGDLKCAGVTPAGGWLVSLDDAWRPGEESGTSIKLQGGAVCTSSPLHRRWRYSDGSEGNHLLDPRTGLSVSSPIAAVSVIARQGWLAEVLSKTVLLSSRRWASGLLARRQAAAIVTYRDGSRSQLP
ncbi:MAG: FAD:protein transferase [Actinomycetota bacterium]|nr:FAD:protein transferase [Actinomycetota bacterium]